MEYHNYRKGKDDPSCFLSYGTRIPCETQSSQKDVRRMTFIERLKWNIQLKSLRNEGIWKIINEISGSLCDVCRFLNQ